MAKKKPCKHPGGRPPKYNPDFHPKLARYMAACGLTDKQIAVDIGIAESTLHKWKIDFSEFSESLREGKEEPDSLVTSALLQRCLGFEHESEHISNWQGEVIKTDTIKKYPPDTNAIKFWLTNRQPDKWREKVTNELVGKGEERLELVPLAAILNKEESNGHSN